MASVAIPQLRLEVLNTTTREGLPGQFPVELLNDPSTNLVCRSLHRQTHDAVRSISRKDVLIPRRAAPKSYLIEADGLVLNSRPDLGYVAGDQVWINDEKLFTSDRPKNLTCYVLSTGRPVKAVFSDVLFRPDLLLDGKIYTRTGPALKCGKYRVIVQERNQLKGTRLTSLAPEDIIEAEQLGDVPSLKARLFEDKLALYEQKFLQPAMNASYDPFAAGSTTVPSMGYIQEPQDAFTAQHGLETALPVLHPPPHTATQGRRTSYPLGTLEEAIEYRLVLDNVRRQPSPTTSMSEMEQWQWFNSTGVTSDGSSGSVDYDSWPMDEEE